MNKQLSGIGKVFSFTTRMTTASNGWKRTTIILSLLLILLPVIIFALSSYFNPSAEELVYGGGIKTVYVCDETEGECDFDTLNHIDAAYSGIYYVKCADFDEAASLAQEDASSVVLHIASDGESYYIDVLTPEGSGVSENDLSLYSDYINYNFYYLSVQKSGLSEEQLKKLSIPTEITVTNPSETGEDAIGDSDMTVESGDFGENNTFRTVLMAVLPYVTVMFMYFFVLFYGQSAAQLVVVEKTSKLMDTVLVSVAPHAMIFGKMLACVFCALIQICIWLISLAAGLLLGTQASAMISGGEVHIIRDIIESGVLDGMFTPFGIIMALLIVAAGCILYCSLASVGGALAGKQEDLQSTNLLFTMAIVVSFLVVIFGGGSFSDSGMISSAPWLNWVPFTAVLVTPSRVLLGEVGIAQGLGSLAVILLTSAVIMYLAGRIYKMMSFYKGNAPKITQVFGMLKNK